MVIASIYCPPNLLAYMTGKLLSGLGKVFDKDRVVALDDLVEQRLLGPWRW